MCLLLEEAKGVGGTHVLLRILTENAEAGTVGSIDTSQCSTQLGWCGLAYVALAIFPD